MINLKEVAETLLQVANNQEQLKSIVDLMESSNNTVKDDIGKLRDGARLEVTFDIDRMYEIAENIECAISSAQDDIRSAENCVQDAAGTLDDADYEIGQLLAKIETAQQELKKVGTKDEKDE